jgi:hypothetical protein
MQVFPMFRSPTSIIRTAGRAAADFNKGMATASSSFASARAHEPAATRAILQAGGAVFSAPLRKRAAVLALAALVLAPVPALAADGAANPAQASPQSLRSHSIVNGMRLQPRPGDLERANRVDVDPAAARELDELFRRLIDRNFFRSLPDSGEAATRRTDQGAAASC